MAASSVIILPDNNTAEEPLLGHSAPKHEPQIVPQKSLTLWDLEEQLVSLLDTEELVDPEDQAEFWRDFEKQVELTVDKREKVAHFLSHLESQSDLASKEIDRLKQRKSRIEGLRDRVETSVIRTIERLGPDAKGKYRKLEGHTCTFSTAALPTSVEILDEEKLPANCRKVEIRIPLDLWDRMLDSVDFDLREDILAGINTPKHDVSRTAVLKAIESAITKAAIEEAKKSGALSISADSIPGARLNLNRRRLVVK